MEQTMTDLRDAKRIARNYLSDINHCVEYTNAFVFSNARSSASIGGADAAVAVLKKTGEVMNANEYFAHYGRASVQEYDL